MSAEEGSLVSYVGRYKPGRIAVGANSEFPAGLRMECVSAILRMA